MGSASVVRVDGLTFAYPAGPPALQDLRFDVRAGECLGIVGPNGAGKTTLFLCFTALCRSQPTPYSFTGWIPRTKTNADNFPPKWASSSKTATTSFSIRRSSMMSRSVRSIWGFQRMKFERDVADALQRVNLVGSEQRVPFHLSSGEKRRAALAGVLALTPDVLLLDEPSAHLDPRGRREFIRLINDLPGTKLLASHDLELILSTCERVLLLDAGKLIVDGPVRDILADRALMEAHGLEVPHSLTYHHEPHKHS